jgi:uncharacterized protein
MRWTARWRLAARWKSTAFRVAALALLLAPGSTLAAAETTPPASPSPAPSGAAHEPEIQLEPYQLVILQRPANPKDYPQDQLDEIQRQHIAHLVAMAKAGKLVVAGPFDDQPDPKWRGLALYRVGSIDEARRLAEEDPAVKAGRLEVVVMTWYTEKGALAFPGAEKLMKGGS